MTNEDSYGASEVDEGQRFLRWVEEEGSVALDGDVIGKFFDLYDYECRPSVRFDWDQWSRCYISCDHGEWHHDSTLLNFTEAFVVARRKWLAGAHHPTMAEARQ